MRKKILVILTLALVLSLSALSACGRSTGNGKDSESGSASTTTYTVTFYVNGAVVKTENVEEGNCVTALPQIAPGLNAGYPFLGWFAGNEEFTLQTTVNSDLEVVAKWSETPITHTIKFMVNGVEDSSDKVIYESSVDLSDYSPMDYEVLKWQDEDGNEYAHDELIHVTQDITFTAVNPQKIIFTYELSQNKEYWIVGGLYSTTETQLTIPSSFYDKPVKEIADKAFCAYNDTVVSLVVPDTITKIGKEAFSGLYALENLTVPFVGATKYTDIAGNGERSLFAYWFFTEEDFDITYKDKYTCYASTYYKGEESDENKAVYRVYMPTSIANLTVNGGVIPSYSFHTVTTLKNIVLGDDVTAIGNDAFAIYPYQTEHKTPELKEITCTQNSNITSIGADCFANQTSLIKFCIPPMVKEILPGLFRPCTSLSDVVFFENSQLEKIGLQAFFGTPITEVDLPAGVTDIGLAAFSGCKLLETVSIPSSAVNIGSSVFSYCVALNSATFAQDNPITAIPSHMFDGCAALTALTIPSTVKKIEDAAFTNCSVLQNIDVNRFTYIGASAFSGTAITEAIFNNDIEYIGSSAFAACYDLAKVVFPQTNCKITEIYGYTFDCDESLKTIVFSDSITALGERSFGYTGLETVTLPANLEKIADRAFLQWIDSGSLISITNFAQLDKLTHIGISAFSDNYALEITQLPANLEYVGDHAFKNTNLTGEITLDPKKLTRVGESAFGDCKNATLSVIETIDDVPTTWHANWAGNTTVKTNYTQLFDGFIGSLTNDIYMVSGYTGTAEEIILPDEHEGHAVVYKNGVFINNTTLVAVTLASGMTEIPNNFFSGCENLTSVTIPAETKLTKIGDYAFNACSHLTIFKLSDASELTYIGSNAFYHCYRLESVNLVNNSKIEYIGESAFATRLPTYNGALRECNIDFTSVKQIGNDAFSGNYELAMTVNLSSSLTSLGANAFKGGLKCTINIPADLHITRYEESVFAQVTSLNFADFSLDGVTYIGNSAFASTKLSVALNIPQSVEYIGSSAFNNCNLTSVTIDSNPVLEICEAAFSSNSALSYVLIKGTPKSIGAFICSSIKNCHIYFTETLTKEQISYPNGGWYYKFTLGESQCAIDTYFNAYNDSLERTSVPYFGKGEWSYGANGEPDHNSTPEHTESGQRDS